MKPVIGLIPLFDDEKNSYWMLPGYMKSLQEIGAFPIMLPLTDKKDELELALSMCNGILLTGGHDVSPELYGADVSDKCGDTCPERDQMEKYILTRCIELDKPVLGICRGIQFINAALGGTLYQDIPSEYPSDVEHHMSPPYDRGVHKVDVLPDTMLADIIGPGEHHVNSYHHQAIKELASRVNAMAISEDGLVEAICIPDKKYIVGVQWHPEFSYEKDDEACKLLRAFVDACIS